MRKEVGASSNEYKRGCRGVLAILSSIPTSVFIAGALIGGAAYVDATSPHTPRPIEQNSPYSPGRLVTPTLEPISPDKSAAPAAEKLVDSIFSSSPSSDTPAENQNTNTFNASSIPSENYCDHGQEFIRKLITGETKKGEKFTDKKAAGASNFWSAEGISCDEIQVIYSVK